MQEKDIFRSQTSLIARRGFLRGVGGGYQFTVPSLILFQIPFPVHGCVQIDARYELQAFWSFPPSGKMRMSFDRQQKPLSKEADGPRHAS